MASDSEKVTLVGWSSGFSLVGILLIVLIIVKAMGKTKLSWVWVFAPLWISILIGLIVMLVTAISGGTEREGQKTKDTEL